MKKLSRGIEIILLLVLSVTQVCYASGTELLSVGISTYGDKRCVITEYFGTKTVLSMYDLHNRNATLAWTYEYNSGYEATLLPLPGIGKLAILTDKEVRVISENGHLVDELLFEKPFGWHYPIYSEGRCSVALNDDKYQFMLTITENEIRIVNNGERKERAKGASSTKVRIVSLRAFLDANGSIYENANSRNGYWKLDPSGSWSFYKTKGKLVYVGKNGPWILIGRTLVLPDGEKIKLPKPRKNYSTGFSHHGGVIISGKFAVSSEDRRFSQCKYYDEEQFAFSDNLKYFILQEDWGNDGPAAWDTWSADDGYQKIPMMHQLPQRELVNPDSTIAISNHGYAVMIGESDNADGWGLWLIDLNTKEYAPVTIIS